MIQKMHDPEDGRVPVNTDPVGMPVIPGAADKKGGGAGASGPYEKQKLQYLKNKT